MSPRLATAAGMRTRTLDLLGRTLVSLLAMCAGLVGVAVPAAAEAYGGGSHAGSGVVVSAGPAGADATWNQSESFRHCDSTSPPWQQMDRKRPQGPAAWEEAGPRWIALDCPGWIPPAGWSVSPSAGLPHEAGHVDDGPGESPQRTFDGRAPPSADV